MTYFKLSHDEIQNLIETIPRLSKSITKKDICTNNNFHMFEQLPEELRFKIGMIATPNFIKTSKSYTKLHNDLMYKKGPSIWEFNNYIKNLPKNKSVIISLFGIFYSENHKHYLVYDFHGGIDLLQNNQLHVCSMGKAKTLLNPESFLDYFIITSGYDDDYKLIEIIYDMNTIGGILSNRTKCLNIDPLYKNKFMYSYMYLLFKHFSKYYGLIGRILSIILFGNDWFITDIIRDKISQSVSQVKTYFFYINDSNEDLINLVNKILSELSGPDNIFVDNYFLN